MGNDVSRRDLVRWSLLGAGSAPLAALVAACGGNDGAASPTTGAGTSNSTTQPPLTTPPTTPPTTAPGTTVAVDPTKPWWLQGNYAPVMEEIDAFDLEVRGALPPELRGTYVKNSSNPPRSDSPHWFFGDGMVHGLTLHDGAATSYRNRWVRTQPFVAGLGFGQGAPGGSNSQSNVSVFHHGGRLLSSGEVGFPYELNPADLSTIGRVGLRGRAARVVHRAPEDRPGDRADARLRLRVHRAVPGVLHHRTRRHDEPPGDRSSCRAAR
jgi:hypothetical protein